MKLVYESLNEFVRIQDPLKTLNIGIGPIIESFKKEIEYSVNNDVVLFESWKLTSIFKNKLNTDVEKMAFENLITEIIEYPKKINKDIWLNPIFIDILIKLNKFSKDDILELFKTFSLTEIKTKSNLLNTFSFLSYLNQLDILFDLDFNLINLDNFHWIDQIDHIKTTHWLSQQSANKIYTLGIKYSNCDLLKKGIEKGATNIAIGDSIALNIAVDRTDIELVKLLLTYPEIDPTANTSNGKRYGTDETNYPLRVAARDGKLDIFKVLMTDGRSNPAANNNFALKHAINNGHLEIAKMLLTDKRVLDNLNTLPKTILKKLKDLNLI